MPFPGIIDPQDGAETGELVLDLIVLSGGEEAEALARARAFAKGKGVDAPKPGDPEFDLGLMVHTLLLACLDHSSPAGAPAPFFVSPDEILQHLDRERIAHLYAMQQAWQEELSPTTKALNEEQILQLVIEAADAEDPLRFFEKLPPGTLARCFLFTARQLRTLLRLRSEPGSSSIPGGGSASTTTPVGSA